jgi:hypothetical protein
MAKIAFSMDVKKIYSPYKIQYITLKFYQLGKLVLHLNLAMIKTKLRIAIISFYSISAFGQGNLMTVLPNDSMVFASGYFNLNDNGYYKTSFWGDTTISSTEYTKIYRVKTTFGPELNYSGLGDYIGGFRQNTTLEKMYFLDLNGVEFDVSELHGKNLQIGDQLFFSADYHKLFFIPTTTFDSIVVTEVQTFVQFNYTWQSLKILIYEKNSGMLSGYFRPGFGFFSVSDISPPITNFNFVTYCFQHPVSPITLPQDSSTNAQKALCVIIKEEPKLNETYLYRDNRDGAYYIKGGDLSNYRTLEIFNIRGQLIYSVQAKVLDSKIAFSISSPNGTYLVRLNGASGVWFSKLLR